MRIKIILAILVFFFALALRLWNLDMMGRWWDEQWYAEKGYILIELIKSGDFNNPYWYTAAADHPPFANYFYGLASYGDLIKYDINAKHLLPTTFLGAPVFTYDLTAMRLVSVFISSISVVLVFLFGARYFSYFVGIVGAVIMAMLPHYLGYSQLVVLESWIVFFFTACVFSYVLYLETNQRRYLFLTAILTGMCLGVKQSNILIYVFYATTYVLWLYETKKKTISYTHLIWLTLISFITYILIWPQPWIYFSEFYSYTYELWFKNRGNIPELLFGISMGARSFFYVIAFFVTTPVIIIILSMLGIKEAWSKRKKWIYLVLIIWFLIPFLMSFFHHRQNMVRYIIQFYAPLALLSAIGFEKTIKFFTKSVFIRYSMIAPLIVYLMIILYAITPYYLNYFNELVGGTKNVYEKQLFFLGWFGEGLKGPGKYIEQHAETNSRIGMALNPELPLYRSTTLQYETFDPKKRYDYVVVNYFNVIRIGFDRQILQKDYVLVYTEYADGAELAWVYKHK